MPRVGRRRGLSGRQLRFEQGRAKSVVAAITKAGGKAVAVGGDITKAAEAQGVIDAAIKAYGRLDILVNNAG